MSRATLYPGRWRSLLVPLCSPAHGCTSPGKHPHRRDWARHALARFESYSEPSAESWAGRMRGHVLGGDNVGLALPPFVAALDVDTDLNGEDRFDGYLARDAILQICDGHPVQQTGETDTGDAEGRRVGVHVWGKLSGRVARGNRYGSIPVTLRHVGHQVVVAPSRRVGTGLEYQWLRELPRDPMELPEFDPTWFGHASVHRGEIKRSRGETDEGWRARVSDAWRRDLANPEVTFSPGQRHEALVWRAWHLAIAGEDPEEIRAALFDLTATRCACGGRFGPAATEQDSRILAREIDGAVRSSLGTLATRRRSVA